MRQPRSHVIFCRLVSDLEHLGRWGHLGHLDRLGSLGCGEKLKYLTFLAQPMGLKDCTVRKDLQRILKLQPFSANLQNFNNSKIRAIAKVIYTKYSKQFK